jgi:outer membrane protein assembly factor BamB
VDRLQFLLAAAAAPTALRAHTPVSYVTADLESHVAVVDLATGRVLRRIPTAPGPRSIERVGERYVVAHTNAGKVSILGHAVLDFDEPRYTAGDDRFAFVTDSGSPQIVAVDVVRGAVVGRVRLKQWPRHLTRRGSLLWVGLGTASPELAVVDVREPRRPRLLRYVRPGFAAHDVNVAPSGRLWITSGDAGTVSAHGRRLAADAAPQHVTFAHGRAYVTSGGDGTLRVYDERSARLLRTLRIPVGSYNVQVVGGDVVTPSLNAGTLTVVGGASVQVARSCHDAA